VRLLLDTHALLFLLGEPERLAEEARDAIENPASEVYFSAVNVWEIEIKAKLRKLSPPVLGVLGAARGLPFGELVISSDHAREAGRLPLLHGDPFDRMLIAQALVEDFTVVTRDQAFANYDVPTLAC
jgi:PIN domain nuclease of toxin-antitoxin system